MKYLLLHGSIAPRAAGGGGFAGDAQLWMELTESSTNIMWTHGCKAKCTLGIYSGCVVFLIIWKIQTQNGFRDCRTIWEEGRGNGKCHFLLF